MCNVYSLSCGGIIQNMFVTLLHALEGRGRINKLLLLLSFDQAVYSQHIINTIIQK